MELKEWVRAARHHAGWTQQRLGDEVGRTKANVAHWESGKHPPSYAQVAQISALTGYPMPDSLVNLEVTRRAQGNITRLAMDSPTQVVETTTGATVNMAWMARYGQVLADLEDLPPEDAEQLAQEIHLRAEKVRRHHAYLLKRDGLRPPTAKTETQEAPTSTPTTQADDKPARGRATVASKPTA